MLLRGLKRPAIGAALDVSLKQTWTLANDGLTKRRAETMDKAEQ